MRLSPFQGFIGFGIDLPGLKPGPRYFRTFGARDGLTSPGNNLTPVSEKD
jgi:hypothetical protein